jgi:hypothetical protein
LLLAPFTSRIFYHSLSQVLVIHSSVRMHNSAFPMIDSLVLIFRGVLLSVTHSSSVGLWVIQSVHSPQPRTDDDGDGRAVDAFFFRSLFRGLFKFSREHDRS